MKHKICSIDCLPLLEISYHKNSISIPADEVFAFFSGGEPGCFHCLDCCLDSGVKWWTRVSSTVTNSAETCQDLSQKGSDWLAICSVLCASVQLSEVLVPNLRIPNGLRVFSYQDLHKNGMNFFLRNPNSISYVSLCNLYVPPLLYRGL